MNLTICRELRGIRKTANLLFLLFQADKREKGKKAGKLRHSQAGSTAIKREKHDSCLRFNHQTVSCNRIRPQFSVYLLMALASSRLGTRFFRLIFSHRAANDPPSMPTVCFGFHEWSDSGDGFCTVGMASASNVMPDPRAPIPFKKLNNRLGSYPIENGLSKRKQLEKQRTVFLMVLESETPAPTLDGRPKSTG